ncbi:uncharacterized protein LOC132899184 isoform X2 [Neoarius graeffei]|uniref:uncharacterized protein LOC132899184 isoform X2 n=1 Tax=Neoarius graeffei TaxID=443677 RepID=UPI00298C56C6|nr:uncharacterized protein LOC132899184 isoform X2 [Neoarius graeffei]
MDAESNSVRSLKEVPFSQRSNRAKLATKQAGPPSTKSKHKTNFDKGGKSYTRGFTSTWSQRKSWRAGCKDASAVFCYPCLLFHPGGGSTDNTAWMVTGVSDMHHLSEKIKKRESSKIHMGSCLKFSAFGRVNIATQPDEGYRLAVRRHNDEVYRPNEITWDYLSQVRQSGSEREPFLQSSVSQLISTR